jgi:hypothetical protein
MTEFANALTETKRADATPDGGNDNDSCRGGRQRESEIICPSEEGECEILPFPPHPKGTWGWGEGPSL